MAGTLPHRGVLNVRQQRSANARRCAEAAPDLCKSCRRFYPGIREGLYCPIHGFQDKDLKFCPDRIQKGNWR